MDLTSKKKLLEAEDFEARSRARIEELERALSLDLDRTAFIAAQAKIRELQADLEARGEHISELYKMIGHAVQHLRLLRHDDAKALLEALLPAMPPAEAGDIGTPSLSASELAQAEWDAARAELELAAGSGDLSRYTNAMQRAQKAKIELDAAPAPAAVSADPSEAPTEPPLEPAAEQPTPQ